MKPIIILDKSVLEGLNPSEMVWLDQFYTTNTTHILHIEILCNLKKHSKNNKDPEESVSNLAFKLQKLHSFLNTNHLKLIEMELLEKKKIDMESGNIYNTIYEFKDSTGKKKSVYEFSLAKEEEERWRRRVFSKRDIENGEDIFNFKKFSSKKLHGSYEKNFANKQKPETFKELKEYVDNYISNENQKYLLLKWLPSFFTSKEQQEKVLTRWKEEGCPPIRKFAPYFTYVTTILNFLSFGMHFKIITVDTSDFIDVHYFFYLPFCNVFTSKDKFHKNLFPLFSNKNQTFICGEDLKEDLKKLDAHYSSLPQEVKDKGISHFANAPPDDNSFLTTQLWDKYASSEWRERKGY